MIDSLCGVDFGDKLPDDLGVLKSTGGQQLLIVGHQHVRRGVVLDQYVHRVALTIISLTTSHKAMRH